MRNFATIFVILALLLILGWGGYWGWQQNEKRQAAQEQYAMTLSQLERLFSDVYVPPDLSPAATQKLRDYGCQDAWLATPQGAKTRFSEAEKLALIDPESIKRLRVDDSPRGNYVRAMLVSHTTVRQRPELADIDPEQLLRRAANKGHGHAIAYFARLRADVYPHSDVPKTNDDVTNFFDINRQFEQAADAGSGFAAYQLGFRTHHEVMEKFLAIDPMSNRKVPRSSRSPQEWWCRAAQLGYAPGQLQCYRVGGRRVEEAQRLLTAAADGGHEVANATLAAAYARGSRGFVKDQTKRKQFLCRAVALGHSPSLATLALVHKQEVAEMRRLQAQAKRDAKRKNRTGRSVKRNLTSKQPAPQATRKFHKPDQGLRSPVKPAH